MSQTDNSRFNLCCRDFFSQSVASRHLSPDQLWGHHLPPVSDYHHIFPLAPRPFIEQDEAVNQEMSRLGGYEYFIEHHGSIPTRPDNWHDYYNALSWHCFPHSKEALHHSQIQYAAPSDSPNARSPQQNGATLFDENGIIVVSDHPQIFTMLRNHHWHHIWWQQRNLVLQHCRLFILGHAMWEKARAPYLGLTAKWLGVTVSPETLLADNLLEQVDDRLPTAFPLVPRHLGPLPLLGWPQMCRASDDESFYYLSTYFRPKRASHGS